MSITVLAAASLAAWSLAALGLLPTLLRIYRGRKQAGDEWRVASLFFAIMIGGFNARRVFALDEHALLPLYCVSIGLGGYVLALLAQTYTRTGPR